MFILVSGKVEPCATERLQVVMELAQTTLGIVQALAWPCVTLIIALLFRSQIVAAFTRLRRASLPGGVSLDFDEELEQAKRISEKVEKAEPHPHKKDHPPIPLNRINARLIQVNLQPSPSGLDLSYYRDLAARDSQLALSGIRMELEIIARNLAKGWDVPLRKSDSTLLILRKLASKTAITDDQRELAERLLLLCEAALHGEPVSRKWAGDVIALADVLKEDYIAWLNWGFPQPWDEGASSSRAT